MSSDDYWLTPLYCASCTRGEHARCDPVGFFCTCWACLPNDFEAPLGADNSGPTEDRA